jgi:hypothetical protein
VVNALAKQRAMLENILRACVGLAPENNMILEHKWRVAHSGTTEEEIQGGMDQAKVRE